jgi:hypothetical protein
MASGSFSTSSTVLLGFGAIPKFDNLQEILFHLIIYMNNLTEHRLFQIQPDCYVYNQLFDRSDRSLTYDSFTCQLCWLSKTLWQACPFKSNYFYIN